MPLRSNPVSSGCRSPIGNRVGAASGPRDAGLYGHLVLALIFNRRGARFIDETLGDHLTAMAAIEQPQARVLVVADQPCATSGCSAPTSRASLRSTGSSCAVGVAAVRAGDFTRRFRLLASGLGLSGRGRASGDRAVQRVGACRPPTRAGPSVRPAAARPAAVLRRRGGCRHHLHVRRCAHRRPRTRARRSSAADPGLLAAGADAGGLFVRAYAGGLAAASVFGLRAAATALGSDAYGSHR